MRYWWGGKLSQRESDADACRAAAAHACRAAFSGGATTIAMSESW